MQIMRSNADTTAGHPVNQLTRQRWQSEWSRYIHERNLWQRVAFLSLGVNVLAILIVAWFGNQTRLIPYIVEVDKLGVTTAIQRADTPMAPNAAIIKSHLAHWIENTRSVYTDVPAEKKAIIQAYAAINHNSAASTMLNDWFNKNQPFKRAETEAVTVQIESVQPISEKTWRIEWAEEQHDRHGGLTSHTEQQATVNIVLNPPTDEPTILANPLGIYVDSFSWSQRI